MIKISVTLPIDYRTEDIEMSVLSLLPISRDEIKDFRIVKRTLNVSDKADIHYDAQVALEVSPERESGLLKMKKKVSEYPDYTLKLPLSKLSSRPIVVGAGPAGLFAALIFAECGAKPLLIERGSDVDRRGECVSLFCNTGILNTECNVQFGEGGAGTYSDGKLKVGSMDAAKMKILSEFVEAGADADILYSASAHLGTDKLPSIVKKLREKIISLGGEVKFDTKMTDIIIKDGRVRGICCGREEYECENLLLATGHSARDVFDILYKKGAHLEPRGFGIGVRVEHPREYINELIYGKNYPPSLGTASYHLVTHLSGGRSVYSFCMCPGGTVVPAAGEEGGIVTNGMSEYLRDADNSNAAFLVSVTPADFGSDHPLAGIDMQKKIESTAYNLTGSYKAPAETLASLVKGEKTDFDVKPSYKIGVERHKTTEYMPEFVTEALKASMTDFDAWLPGFYYSGAAVIGPETRTTSPVRVTRHESGEALGIKGLYPVGEGAGYSGGIVSSAKDGIAAALKILENDN